jgi:hypothetical protein
LPSLFRIENNSRDNVPKDNTQRCTEDEKGHVEADIFFITDRVNPYWEVYQIEHLTKATHQSKSALKVIVCTVSKEEQPNGITEIAGK